MSLLFQLNFVHESRTLQPNSHTFLGLVQAQRERCTQYAALQRVAHACHMQDICTYSGSSNHEQPQAYVYLAQSLDTSIPACVEACPWLEIGDDERGRPYFLWGVSNE